MSFLFAVRGQEIVVAMHPPPDRAPGAARFTDPAYYYVEKAFR
jgi:hypothetical protein